MEDHVDTSFLKVKLLEIAEKENGLFPHDGFSDGFRSMTELKIASLQKQEPVGEFDDFHKHVLVHRMYKNKFLEKKPYAKIELDEVKNEIDTIVENVCNDGEQGLYFFFSDGQENGFIHYDGIIDVKFAVEEVEEHYDIFIYYAYIGK